MPWEKLGIFFIKDDWTLTKPVEGELFRIKHFKIYQSNKYYLKGVIAQAFKDSFGINTFDDKRFGYRPDPEIFEFYFPVGLGEHSLAFKRLDNSNITWRIEAEVFYSENPAEDYQNYITNRFGQTAINQINQTLITNTINNMSLYPLLFSGSTTPKSETLKLVANKATKLLSSNDSRTRLRIYSTGHPILLATGFDENGQPLEKLLQLPPNYYHEDVITSAGMYKGDIYAISEQETYITVIEFSAE